MWDIVDVNIRISWIFVKTTLVCYFGQAAYLIHHEGQTLVGLGGESNPFYLIMADWFNRWNLIATLAAVIASQACGSFMINEAMRLVQPK
jgi:KUP system potassium uptake protein